VLEQILIRLRANTWEVEEVGTSGLETKMLKSVNCEQKQKDCGCGDESVPEAAKLGS